MHYFSLFFKIISKPCVKLLRVWTKNTIGWEYFEKILKIFDDNSIEKLNFYLFLGKVVAKNRGFGNNIIFLQQFFRIRGGGGWTPVSPCVRHCFFSSLISLRVIFLWYFSCPLTLKFCLATPMLKNCSKWMLFPKRDTSSLQDFCLTHPRTNNSSKN